MLSAMVNRRRFSLLSALYDKFESIYDIAILLASLSPNYLFLLLNFNNVFIFCVILNSRKANMTVEAFSVARP